MVFLVGIVCNSLGFLPAYAQEKKAEFTLEEIIVTAERRETSIMDTPLSVSAIDADSLDQQNISGTFEILMQTPSTAYWGDNIYIRGIGKALLDLQADPAVGIFYDGAYNEWTTRLDQMVDVERVETVRGPQSTMYGKNTIAGAVNVIFAKPTKGFHGQVKARIGNYSSREFTGILNVPLIGDWLLGRMSFIDTYDGGYVKNYTLNTYSGTTDNWKLHLKLLFQPTDNFSMYLQYKHLYETGNNSQEEHSTLSKVVTDDALLWIGSGGNQWNAIYGTPENPNLGGQAPQVSLANELGHVRDWTPETSLATELSFGDLTLKHHMFYRTYYWYSDGDSDDGPSPYAFYFGSAQLDGQEWAQDLQVLYGGADSWISLLGGLYYFHTSKFYRDRTYRDGPAYWEFAYSNTSYTPFLVNGRHMSYQHSTALDNDSKSAYLNADIDIIKKKLTLSLGARYNVDEKDTTEDGDLAYNRPYGSQYTRLDDTYRADNNITDTIESAGLDPLSNAEDAWAAHQLGYYFRQPLLWIKYPTNMPQTVKQDWDAWTWKTGLTYKINETDMTYLSVSRGYKPGGISISNTTGAKSIFGPEYVMAYETGWKSTWLENRLNATISVFYNDYKDKQQNFYIQSIDPTDGTITLESLVTNAGKLESYGVEFEGVALITQRLRVSWAYSYLHGEYKEFVAYSSFTEKNEDIAGNTMPEAPKHKINLQATYTYPTDIGDFSIHGSYSWQDEMVTDFFNRWYSWVKPWDRVDAELMWFSPDYKWRIILWGKNVFDHRTATFVTGSPETDQPEPKNVYLLSSRNEWYMAPFRFGIEVSYKW